MTFELDRPWVTDQFLVSQLRMRPVGNALGEKGGIFVSISKVSRKTSFFRREHRGDAAVVSLP